MQSKCLVCESNMSPSKSYPGLLKCFSCGFLTADIKLSTEDAARLYGIDYFHGQEYSDYTRDKVILQRNFSRRIDVLKKYIKDSHVGLLEIGCAYGFFLDLVKDEFRSVVGIDISFGAVEYAQSVLDVNAISGNFLDMEMKPYDVCCMWDTIEHISSPGLFIRKISE